MMQENNLLNRNNTNDIQGVKLTYALVILISSIETENQPSYCGSTIVIAWSGGELRINFLSKDFRRGQLLRTLKSYEGNSSVID